MRISCWSSDVCSSDLLDLDVERQGAKRAGEAAFVCGEGADVSHDVSPFGLSKVAPVRPCCEPAGGGWAGRTAQRSQQRGEPGSAKNRSAELRVGKECVRTSRSRGSPYL